MDTRIAHTNCTSIAAVSGQGQRRIQTKMNTNRNKHRPINMDKLNEYTNRRQTEYKIQTNKDRQTNTDSTCKTLIPCIALTQVRWTES